MGVVKEVTTNINRTRVEERRMTKRIFSLLVCVEWEEERETTKDIFVNKQWTRYQSRQWIKDSQEAAEIRKTTPIEAISVLLHDDYDGIQ